MSNMVLTTTTIKEWFPNYRGGNSYPMKMVGESEVLKVNEWVKSKMDNVIISPNEKVYISPDTGIPVYKFKQYYPNNKIVHQGSDADVIVGKLDNLSTIDQCYKFYHIKDNVYSRNINEPTVTNRTPVKMWHHDSIKSLVTYINAIGDKKFILHDRLELGGAIMDDDMFERIKNMLSSSDDEMVQLGRKAIASFSYKDNKAKLAVLYTLPGFYKTGLATSKDFTYIKRMLSEEFHLSGTKINSGITIDFWVRLALNYPNDKCVSSSFRDWLVKESPSLKGFSDFEVSITKN